VGIQGSGKTTTAAKLARFYQKRGVKTRINSVQIRIGPELLRSSSSCGEQAERANFLVTPRAKML